MNYRLSYEEADELIDIAPKEEEDLYKLNNLLMQRKEWRKSRGSILIEQTEGRLKLENQDKSNPILELRDAEVLHWHGETFDLPSGCERLASNSNYSNQAFKYKDLALGLQFHIEVTSTGLESWYKVHKHELNEEKIDIEY